MSVSFAHSQRRVDRWQQRRRALAIPVAVIKKFVDDGADRLGVQVAYWGFFSVFALLLVFTSILGFVFESNPGLQHELLDSTLERMPVIGPQISGDIGSLTGSAVALALGVAGALWTGLGVTLAIGHAIDRIGPCHAPTAPAFSARGCAVCSCWHRSAPLTSSRPLRSVWCRRAGWARW
jgi:uncharacterized BrkB/YihY/UPF0761 family membrane protein